MRVDAQGQAVGGATFLAPIAPENYVDGRKSLLLAFGDGVRRLLGANVIAASDRHVGNDDRDDTKYRGKTGAVGVLSCSDSPE
jgi:hypothetical protein